LLQSKNGDFALRPYKRVVVLFAKCVFVVTPPPASIGPDVQTTTDAFLIGVLESGLEKSVACSALARTYVEKKRKKRPLPVCVLSLQQNRKCSAFVVGLVSFGKKKNRRDCRVAQKPKASPSSLWFESFVSTTALAPLSLGWIPPFCRRPKKPGGRRGIVVQITPPTFNRLVDD
jgi:hypothetical protein